jgi:hypothetical protein
MPRYADALDMLHACAKLWDDENQVAQFGCDIGYIDADKLLAEDKREIDRLLGLQDALKSELMECNPYYVTREMFAAIDGASTKLPEFTLAEELFPTKNGFVFFAGEPVIGAVYAKGDDRPVAVKLCGMMWAQSTEFDSKVHFIFYSRSERGWIVPFLTGIWPYGKSYLSQRGYASTSADVTDDVERSGMVYSHIIELVASFLLFVNQKVVAHETVTPDRATRRRLERERSPLRERTIHVVYLRSHERGITSGDDKKDVDWHYRWAVSGHWRTYTGKGNRRQQTIWIDPYIKGDDALPLKDDAPTKLIAVVR